ncbi:amidohydrolase [Vallitalea maricola]|uniref:Amidohydrolase family protein n=1 Tax=Vallitalea maricola TaxID=3074433 RepID=A0ACB5UFA3_9FIRM|nr:amidohydrolase family protein [Vallitalea sp. AN17-2]
MNKKNCTAEILLKSTNIFTATSNSPFSGYIAIKGNKIISIDSIDKSNQWIGTNTKVLDLDSKVVCPGFVDVHTFFTGYALKTIGVDLKNALTPDEAIQIVKIYSENKPSGTTILGHNWNNNLFANPGSAILDTLFSDTPIILFSKDNETCWMNSIAIEKYNFTPNTCYPEAFWRLIPEILKDKPYIIQKFREYMKMLNQRGITSIKEMGFDDFYGFTNILDEMEKSNELTLRVSFMSQPVGSGVNIQNGILMREQFKGEFVKFSGYNRMTDGSIAVCCGDLIEPYNCLPGVTCAQKIDYDMIEKEVLEADEKGFRFSLHAQGDGAIRKVIDIYDKCHKKNGKLTNRHSITDLEFSNPIDLERMGQLGITAEIYPQIMSLGSKNKTIPMIENKIGKERGRYYWNRRKMIDSGINVSCGTDLPLLIPDIPESIYHACGGLFPEGDIFNKENTLTISELLKAWTIGGQINLGNENILGTLEENKLADITVLDTDIFNTPIEDMRKAKVCLTISNGNIVYNNLD